MPWWPTSPSTRSSATTPPIGSSVRRPTASPKGWPRRSAGCAREGAEHLGLAWPAEGDPAGLGGPAELNAAAFEAGEAVIAGAHGWVPRREGAVVFWHAYAARPRQLTDVGEADRRLRLAMVHTADKLAALDVARWRPDVADELTDLRTVRSAGLSARHAAALRRARRTRPPGRGHRRPGPRRRRRGDHARGGRGPAYGVARPGHRGPARAGRGLLPRGLAARLTAGSAQRRHVSAQRRGPSRRA